MKLWILALVALLVSCKVQDSNSCKQNFVEGQTYGKLSMELLQRSYNIRNPSEETALVNEAYRLSKLSDLKIYQYLDCTKEIKRRHKKQIRKEIRYTAKEIDSLYRKIIKQINDTIPVHPLQKLEG